MAKERRCATCDAPLPVDARANQKYCDADCRRGKPKERQVVEEPPAQDSIVVATEKSIAAADLGDEDAGAVAALRFLALKIDTEQQVRELALEYAETNGVKPPPVDNVSIPTYLKYCESLGLTPAGRGKLTEKKPEGAKGGKLAGLRSVPKPA